MPADDAFNLEALTSRIEAIRAAPEPEEVRLLVLDSITPGQTLELDVPLAFVEEAEKETVVMVGRARPGLVKTFLLDNTAILTHGVECRVERVQRRDDGSNSCGVLLMGGRYCEIASLGEDRTDSTWLGRTARVQWLSLDASAPEDEATPEILARAEALGSLVSDWIALVRSSGRERVPDHIKTVLEDLGPIPEATRPSARALWVAGLINPLPGLGVALEIRPACLMAPSADLKLQVVEMGLKDSIERMSRPGPPF